MPEGDTVHKVARVIDRELTGHTLTSSFVRGVHCSERLSGSRVTAVEALGKHMLVHFDCDLQLRVHLGMKGSWHRYPPGARWKRSRKAAVVILETECVALACFGALDLELIPKPQRHWNRKLANLGPDLLADSEPDWQAIVRRVFRIHSKDALLGEVLLDQRVAAGIGNVYKSELAFMGGLETDPFKFSRQGFSPWCSIAVLKPETIAGLYKRARRLLQANLGGWSRTTRVDRRVSPVPKGGVLYVYGRNDGICYRCGQQIERGYQGLQNRVTYWCPGCQRLAPLHAV